ncbi:hypothetical protein [Microlunatus parietis]|uniref:Uncharacterized protein n=2 Tax=Microlunatus parietis TaxID=682979 RepID=A0A7Y9LEU1_9ACTN|nr:hypothetical protein [Microlunatus parietis]NYE74173.1 hypothetical protein [Microlunatus parietis]
MTPLLLGLLGWTAVSIVAGLIWRQRAQPRPPHLLTGPPRAVIILAVIGLAQLGVAIVASATPPAGPVINWLGVGAAAVSTVITGGTVTTIVLSLARATAPTLQVGPSGARIQREMLRGGAWIGVLERIGIMASLLTWPEGVALILAIKGLARYPELKAGATSGTAERFIIGTLVSFGWAAGCAGISWLIIT